jgi:hypothetical protein
MCKEWVGKEVKEREKMKEEIKQEWKKKNEKWGKCEEGGMHVK